MDINCIMLNFAQQTRVMCLASLAFSLASSARIVQFFCCCAVSLYRFCQHNDDILRLKLFPYFSLEISHPHYKYYTILSGVSLCQTFFPFCSARLGSAWLHTRYCSRSFNISVTHTARLVRSFLLQPNPALMPHC